MNKPKWSQHGKVGTRVYNAWTRMRSRCRNPKGDKWLYYGGRGITVCEQWDSFSQFLADMGEPPTEKHTIDRINPNGNYEPGNCRWATMAEQQEFKRPRKTTVWLTFQGETLSVTDWAKKICISRFALYERIKAGWKTEDVLTRASHCGVSSGGWRKVK